jgi:sortase A
MPAGRAAVVAMLGGLTAVALWFVLFAVSFSGLQESHSQHLLYAQLRSELSQATVPFGGVIAPGTPIAYLDAGAIGLHAVVVEGTSSADLARGPGHLPSSPLPGQAGDAQIYGRSAMFGAPFGNVHDLRKGVIIAVTTGQGVFYFRVLDVRGPGDPLPSAAQLGQSSLTLVTSAGSGWVSGWTNDHVIYADAALIAGRVPVNGQVRLVIGAAAIQPTPRGGPTIVPTVDNPLASDTTDPVLFSVFLWLLALLLLSVGLACAYIRWTAWQVWVVGVPALLAVLWATTSAAMLLLPNLA